MSSLVGEWWVVWWVGGWFGGLVGGLVDKGFSGWFGDEMI